MTINTQTNSTTVLGTGSQTQFGFSFIGVAAAYISVIYTDANGNETVLQQGSGSSQYQISLNAPVTGALWGQGGTVTYNPGGSPIALGTTLTIFRTLPLTQAISLQNLISLATLGNGAEMGLDTLEMQLQQLSELQGRAIVAPIVDPSTINLTLPAAAQRANTGLAFDSQGNVIAGTTPATGLISSAMQPVVDAASLALGRTAFGLGAMAVEGIGAGLQDDGAGNARVYFNLIADATNQTVTAAFHLTQRVASAASLSASLFYTLPRANTLFNGFGFWVFALSGNATLTPNANDNFDGLASGVSVSVPQGSWAWITTNAASSGTWHIEYNNENVALQAVAVGNTLVVTLNATALRFRDPTLTSGDQIWQNIPSGLNITVPDGATLGTSNGVPCRVWLFIARNNGVPVLGVAVASTATAIFPIGAWETIDNTAAQISTGSDSAGVLYTNAAISADVVRLLGYVEFSPGQSTAGVWATAPSKVQPLTPGMKNPGDLVQTNFEIGSAPSVPLTPTSTINPVRVMGFGSNNLSTTGNIGPARLRRNGGAIGQAQSAGSSGTVLTTVMPIALIAIDLPETTSTVTYTLTADSGTTQQCTLIADEIMG